MNETYTTARKRLLAGLHEKGWTTKPDLKVPKAIKGDTLITFHAQAVYLGEHSMFLDIRNMQLDEFIKHIDSWKAR